MNKKELMIQTKTKLSLSQLLLLVIIFVAGASVVFSFGLIGFHLSQKHPPLVPSQTKLADWINVKKSTNKEIVSVFTLPTLPIPEEVTGEDGLNYKRYKQEKNYSLINKEGEPELPVKYAQFQIPKDAANLKVEILNSESKDENNVNIYPSPHRYFKDENGVAVEKEQFTKGDIYTKDTWYPEKPAEIFETGFLRQVNMVSVALYPVQFNPQKKSLKQFSSMEVKITYTSNEVKNEILIDIKDPTHKIFLNILPNYTYTSIKNNVLDEVEGEIYVLTQQNIVNPNPGFTVDYLIICADAFCGNSISPSLNNLAMHRTIEYYDIGIVKTSDIYVQYPATSNEQSIKNFIQFTYDNWRPEPQIPDLDFILLVGDADYGFSSQNWFLPLWRSNEPPTWGTPEQNIWEGTASDNDYACMNGLADTIPDLMIGRFPVKNETELNNMVSKTLYFETHPLQGQNHWGTRNLYLAGSNQGGPNPQTNIARDMLIEHHQEAEEYNANDSNPDWQWYSDKVTDYLNTEGALMLTYNGHGSIEQTNPLLFVSELNNVNQQPAVFFSFSCDNGAFDHNVVNSNAENWTKAYSDRGAVASFASSRLAYTVSWLYSDDILNIIYDDENYLLGSIIQQAKTNFITGDERKRFNLLGDPALNFSNHVGQSTKPELSSFTLSLSNPAPAIGETIAINMGVTNIGLEATQNVLVQLFEEVNGQLVQVGNDQVITSLAGGNSANLQQLWVYNGNLSTHFVFKVDPQNTVDELSDYNNHLINDFYFCMRPIYVDTSNNSGIEDGSFEHPFNTIPEAFAYAEANRVGTEIITIYVMEGTYGDTLSIPEFTYLKGLGEKENIIITGGVSVVDSSDITIENFTFDPNIWIMGYFFPYGNIIGNIFRHCPAIYTINANFNNNIFYENDIAIASYNGTLDINLENNIFYENGIVLQNLYVGYENNNIYLTNNTFTNNNTLFDYAAASSLVYHDVHYRNNIIWGNNELVTGNGAADLHFYADYNDSDDPTILNAGQNNINTDPLFTNNLTHDYILQSGSPCINTGDPATQYNDPDNSRNDMGAYGGPNAQIPQTGIYITNPLENQVVSTLAPTITWNTNGITASENLQLKITHQQGNIKPVSYQSGFRRSFLSVIGSILGIKEANAATKEYIGTVTDLNVTVPNNGSYTVPIDVLHNNINYTLELSRQSNPNIKDTVHFWTP